jgi:hypothetical protein
MLVQIRSDNTQKNWILGRQVYYNVIMVNAVFNHLLIACNSLTAAEFLITQVCATNCSVHHESVLQASTLK